MYTYRRLTLRVIVSLMLVVGGFGVAGRVSASRGTASLVSGPNPTVVNRHMPYWTTYDRAAYVVSTLNLPLCQDGSRLADVLHDRYHAHDYTVVQSTDDPDVSFIQVRSSSRRVIAVYAYRMGFQYPEGVWSAQCSQSAPDTVIRLYRSYGLVKLQRFTSTLPGV